MAWPLVLIAGFVIPGGGHFALGERKRGALIGSTIVLLFILGILIGGIRVVEFPDFAAQGNLLAKLLTQPTFDCAFFAGPISIICGYISQGYANDPATSELIAHSRLFDIGGLYIGVAGGLNLLAMVDCVGRSAEGGQAAGPQAAGPLDHRRGGRLVSTVATAILAAYTRPFLQPLPVWDYWPALLVPLLLAIAIVYKGTKVSHLRELPWASVVMVFWVLCAFIGIATGLTVLMHFVQ